MALVVTINGVDKTNAIKWRDFVIEQNVTKEADLCNFNLDYKAGGYKPDVNQTFLVTNNGVKLFAGTIIEVTDKLVGGRLEQIECVAKDYTFDLDRKLVTTSYANKTADYIIKDIVSLFCKNFTTTHVASGAGNIKKLTFNYETPSKAIQRVADLMGWDWYVDYDKDVWFFKEQDLSAPFELNETDADSFIASSLSIKQDLSQIKNSIYVRGGSNAYSLTSTQGEVYVADGKQNVFVVGHAFTADTALAVELSTDNGSNWSSLFEGKYGTDNPADYDILYDPNKRAVIFRQDNKPSSGNLVRVYGSYELPVIVYRSDQASISRYGEFQFRIVDNSITSKDEASQKALAELRKYAEKAHTGGFKTYKDGLGSGQWVNVNLPSLGLVGKHKIQKLRISVFEPSTPKFLYEATTVASEIVGSVDILGKLLIGDVNQNIVIDQNEIVDTVYGFSEETLFVENWIATVHPTGAPTFAEVMQAVEAWRTNPWGLDVLPLWVAGNYYPTGSSDRQRTPLADGGAKAI